jgi:transcriptional regulator with XRE-family HTH domain
VTCDNNNKCAADVKHSCYFSEKPMTPEQQFGRRLKALRVAAGLTQKQLADAVGASQTAVGFWERGAREPGALVLPKIAAVLGVSVDALFTQPEPEGELVAALAC